ncbi:MAG: heme lyase CcmF/NrfE family subunit, partial [Candidatus Dadabacteria bacterium]|nr:heme lyase CcmF/NrfE family subunit [Candidatus Dadabacteria bacterium]
MSDLGSISILLSFFITIYSLVACAIAAKTGSRAFAQSGGNGLVSVAFLLLVAVCCLVYELVTLDFSLRYVALNTSTDLPVIYRVTALWAGQAGSLLLWSFILSLYAAFVVLRSRKKGGNPYVNAVLCVVSLFFLFLITYVEDPFEKLGVAVGEGRGLNPILQNGYMAIHPITLYVGYVGITVPFAFGIAALLSGRLGDEWIRNCRKYALFSWMFLSAGLLLGARWAYLELGWGGYWAWDPVENAAFMPWLAGTAFLHSVMIQERKAMLKKWNMILLIITFFLSIFGTFITRSGIVSSVHSFARSDIGPLFLGFMVFILLFSFALLAYRSKELGSEEKFDSPLSRESAFLFNNLLFLAAAFSVFLGTIFPVLSEAFTGKKILVGPPYFNAVGVPIGLVLILLMGIGPLISWKKASSANLKRNFVFPAAVFLVVLLALVVFGMREPVALLSFALCGFVASTVFLEYFRGIKVRSSRGENPVSAFFNLISRN